MEVYTQIQKAKSVSFKGTTVDEKKCLLIGVSEVQTPTADQQTGHHLLADQQISNQLAERANGTIVGDQQASHSAVSDTDTDAEPT